MNQLFTLITVITTLMVLTSFTSLNALATFPDVEPNAWFTPYVEEVVEQGLMDGYPDGRFGSWDTINRAEFAKVILNLKHSLQETWWDKHLFEVLLSTITLFGWIVIAIILNKIAKRPIIIENHSNQQNQKPLSPIQKNSKLIAEENPNSHPARLDNDFQAEEEQKRPTNWWL